MKGCEERPGRVGVTEKTLHVDVSWARDEFVGNDVDILELEVKEENISARSSSDLRFT